MVKRPGKSWLEKGIFGPHALPASGHSPCRDVGKVSGHWVVSTNPFNKALLGPTFSHYESSWNHSVGLIPSLCQGASLHMLFSHTQVYNGRVSKVQKKTWLPGEQRADPKHITLSWRSWTSHKDEQVDVSHVLCQDLWSPEERISIWVRDELWLLELSLQQSFLLKYNSDRAFYLGPL